MGKERIGSRLSGDGFTRGMLADLEKSEIMASFAGQGLITDVLGVIGDGKEATVYCCAADPGVGVERLAAKVYRSERFRAFRGARRYAGGRSYGDKRVERAMQNQTTKGRRMAHHAWIDWEWQTLCTAYDRGADVPDVLARSADAILMEYLGDAEGPAPQLRHVELTERQAESAFRRLLKSVERLLDCHVVHGDLSPYNILWWDDRAWIIDLPQAIDARQNRDAFTYLKRDVANLERYFARYGLSAARTAERLWARYRRGELGR